jgi:hypothetical protein
MISRDNSRVGWADMAFVCPRCFESAWAQKMCPPYLAQEHATALCLASIVLPDRLYSATTTKRIGFGKIRGLAQSHQG